jgi:hypothetical protein
VGWLQFARGVAALGLLLLASMPSTGIAQGKALLRARSNEAVATTPALTTDAANYPTHSVVHVTGSGFQADTRYALPVMAPDGNVEKVNPNTYQPTLGVWGMVTADANGNLSYHYQLDDEVGTYTARAYPSSWSGAWDGSYLAGVTFTVTVATGMTTLAVPEAATVGARLADSATLWNGTSQISATDGSITFSLYSPGQYDPGTGTCSGTPVDTEQAFIGSNGSFSTPIGYVSDQAGTRYWAASYSGDTHYAPCTEPCANEPVAVGRAMPAFLSTARPLAGLPYRMLISATRRAGHSQG